MRTRSLKLRLVALGGVTIALALLVAGWGIVQLFERHVERRAASELDTYIRQISAGVTFDAEGRIGFSRTLPDPRFGEPLSGLYWQIEEDADSQILRSRSLWDGVLKLPADVLDVGSVHQHDLDGPSHAKLLTRERRVSYRAPKGLRGLRIAVALDTREIRAATAEFSWDVVIALGLLGAALLAAAWVQITFGLKPLNVLQQSVLAVRSGSKRHIDVIEPNEVMPLVLAVNSLLDAQTQAIETAKARAADLAHGLKTPLTVLLADATKLRESGAAGVADEIEELTLTMRRHIDRELSRVRLQNMGTLNAPRTNIETVVTKLVRALGRTPKGEVLAWHVRIGQDVAAPIRLDDLAELVGNLLDNACKWANTAVTITAEVKDGVTVTIEDDGPGAPASSVYRLGERGLRLDEQVSGSGFGLAIAHDIANAYGGSLRLGNIEPHGFRASVSFPAQGETRSSSTRSLTVRKAAE